MTKTQNMEYVNTNVMEQSLFNKKLKSDAVADTAETLKSNTYQHHSLLRMKSSQAVLKNNKAFHV